MPVSSLLDTFISASTPQPSFFQPWWQLQPRMKAAWPLLAAACFSCLLWLSSPGLQQSDYPLPAGGAVLDLMSSWVSHLPAGVKYSKVVGHGMNAAELAKNKQLDSFFVRDLNAEPDGWALPDSSFDAVTCCVR